MAADNPYNGVYLSQHLANHISTTRHHLTGAPDHPEPPYAPSFHPPTGYWTPTEKALFFRALSVHSRLRPDLIAASIGTKSTVDVAIYLCLLRQGATRVNNGNNKSTSSYHGAATITIGRDQHPAAHQVSAELITFEDQQAAHISVAEPVRIKEVESEARAETLRSVKNSMRVPRGEGRKGRERDREGQLARKEEFERLRAEREFEWARGDVLARLDVVALQVLDRMLRVDEERRVKAGSDAEEEGEGKSSTVPHPVASSSTPAGGLHPTTPSPSPPATPTSNDNEDDAGAVPSHLSPASRRLISKRLYMRRKRAEASGGTAQLNPARLKPGRKESATSKYRQPKLPHTSDDDGEDPNPNPNRPERGDTRPYKIQSEFEQLGIGADYMRENGLGLFHLGALGRLMRCVFVSSGASCRCLMFMFCCFRLYPRLDAWRPENVAESIAKETIQTLHELVVQFTRDLVRRAITLRELDFALRAHTKVWRLGERVVRPLHVRPALELCGGARLSERGHFRRLVERFSDGEESEDGYDDDDVPLAERARMKKAKAIACDEDEDEDEDASTSVGESEQQQQQAGPSKDVQANEVTAWQPWPSSHRAIYSPFVYAPDLIASSHPFGVYAPGTIPEPISGHVTYQYDDNEDEDEEEEDLMPIETDEDALEVELRAEALLDAADTRAAAAYEAGVWRELRRSRCAGASLRRSRKRRRSEDGDGDEVEVGGVDGANVSPSNMRLRTRKKRKKLRASGEGADSEMYESPAGGVGMSAAVIEDSDSE